MRLKQLFPCVVLFGALVAASPAHSQVSPAAYDRLPVLSVGAGPSFYNLERGVGVTSGVAIWADVHPHLVPPPLRGLGAELEARSSGFASSSDYPSNYREVTVGGGPIYEWARYRNFRPYGKFLIDYGGMNFEFGDYRHDTGIVKAPGGGFQVRLYHNFWGRADYEYHFWGPAYYRNPQGFTFGVTWDVSRFHRH